jgi:hypothetical protein
VEGFTIHDLTLVNAQLFMGFSDRASVPSYMASAAATWWPCLDALERVEPGALPSALRLTPAAGGFSVGDVTGSSRRTGTVNSGAGVGGDAGRRGSVRVLADFVLARAQPAEQAPGVCEQPARLDFVFTPTTLSQTHGWPKPKSHGAPHRNT